MDRLHVALLIGACVAAVLAAVNVAMSWRGHR